MSNFKPAEITEYLFRSKNGSVYVLDSGAKGCDFAYGPLSLCIDMADELSTLRAKLAEAERRYAEEYAIVDRVWKALGTASYKDAGGKAIDELVAAATTRATSAEQERNRLREACQAALLALRSGGYTDRLFNAIDAAIAAGEGR